MNVRLCGVLFGAAVATLGIPASAQMADAPPAAVAAYKAEAAALAQAPIATSANGSPRTTNLNSASVDDSIDADTAPSPHSFDAASEVQPADFMTTISAIEKDLQRQPDGTLRLLPTNKRPLTLTSEQEAFAVCCLEHVNEMLTSGYLTVRPNSQLQPRGANYNYIHWTYGWNYLGVKVGLDSHIVDIICWSYDGISIATGIIAIAFPPAAPVALTIASIAQVDRWYLQGLELFGGGGVAFNIEFCPHFAYWVGRE